MQANFWVLACGVDCDGCNNGKIVPFASQSEADEWAKELNEGSDGIVYAVTSSMDDMMSYCMDYEKDFTNYLNAQD